MVLGSAHFGNRDARPGRRNLSALLYLRSEPLRISSVEMSLAGRARGAPRMCSSLCFLQTVIKTIINTQSKTCSGWNVDW